jgi:hypothetical protein
VSAPAKRATTPLDRVATVARARADAHRAASGWSDGAVLLLAALVRLGEPTDVLAQARASTAGRGEARGTPNRYVPTTALEWARGSALATWRELGRLLGVDSLPAPGNVHDSIAALGDASKPEPEDRS